jgi:hypothetical protein
VMYYRILNGNINNALHSHKPENQNIEVGTWLHVAFECCVNMHWICVAYKIELTLGHHCTSISAKPLPETYLFTCH